MSSLNLMKSVSKAILCACYYKYQREEQVQAKTAWPINRSFSTSDANDAISGTTDFAHSAWSDFVTYKVDNGSGAGHVTPYALAKNYLEISATALFRQQLGIDHVNMDRAEWAKFVFFMRYQEITLDEAFYELLNCPRAMKDGEYTPVSLRIDATLSHVGKSSFVVTQELTVGGQPVGRQHMQICCINAELRKSAKMPDSFLESPSILPLREVKRPDFPLTFLTDDMKHIGSIDRAVFMSDTDENNHLNEAGYIRFVMDACHALMPTCTKSSRIKSIKGLYKRELREGDVVTVTLLESDEDAVAVILQNGQPVFEAQVILH